MTWETLFVRIIAEMKEQFPAAGGMKNIFPIGANAQPFAFP